MRARSPILIAILATLLAAAGAAMGASSSVVVTMTVASSTSLADNCTDASAGHQLGTVLPGDARLTATGADVCSFTFGSTNDTAMLRMSQADGTGTAMGGQLAVQDTGAPPDGDSVIAWGSATDAWRSSSSDPSSIEHSADGGVTWTSQHSIGNSVTDIAALGGGVVIAVGQNQKVGVTTDGGTSWTTTILAAAVDDLYTVTAVSATEAFIGGDDGDVFYTNDSGASWQDRGHATASNVMSIDAIDASNVVAVGTGGLVMYSTDGGATSWTEATPNGSWRMEYVSMVDANTWYLVNKGQQVSLTTNQGAGYATRAIDHANGDRAIAVHATSASDAVVVGRRGMTLATADAGITWTRTSMLTSAELQDISASGSDMLAIGHGGVVLASSDGGASWNVRTAGSQHLAGVHSDGGTLVAVGGQGQVRRSHDAGSTWSESPASGTTSVLRDVSGAGDVMVAVGEAGTIIRSTDDGATWSTVTSPTVQHLWAIDFATDSVAWAVGSAGTILRSDDAGATWATQTSNTTVRLNAVAAHSATLAVAGDNLGDVHATTDGGTTWARSYDGSWWSPIRAVGIQDDGTWVATYGYGWGTVTTDGGATWTGMSGFGNDGYAIVAGADGITMAAGRYISRSTDAGATWAVLSGSWQSVEALSRFGDLFVAVGTEDGGIRSSTTDELADYALGTTDWDAGSNMFGVCLQAVGGSAVADWTVDAAGVAGQCEAEITDPWNALPTAPTKVAHTTAAGDSGSVDVVWGVRTAAAEAPGSYSATVLVETLAPDA